MRAAGCSNSLQARSMNFSLPRRRSRCGQERRRERVKQKASNRGCKPGETCTVGSTDCPGDLQAKKEYNNKNTFASESKQTSGHTHFSIGRIGCERKWFADKLASSLDLAYLVAQTPTMPDSQEAAANASQANRPLHDKQISSACQLEKGLGKAFGLALSFSHSKCLYRIAIYFIMYTTSIEITLAIAFASPIYPMQF